MAENYYDYSKMNKVSPYKAGKTDAAARFSKNTTVKKADDAAKQRNADVTAAKDKAAQSQKLSAVKQAVSAGAASSLSGNAPGLDSVLQGAIGAKISKKA
ncbi:MAG: hypothetical protein HZB29_06295 [Nitrospinae bacterium]|nr:hypothetical protein [Nitrospinota bacterium]